MIELKKVERAAEKSRAARKDLDDAIRAAASVTSMRAVAEAAGLSATRVHQIVHGKSK